MWGWNPDDSRADTNWLRTDPNGDRNWQLLVLDSTSGLIDVDMSLTAVCAACARYIPLKVASFAMGALKPFFQVQATAQDDGFLLPHWRFSLSLSLSWTSWPCRCNAGHYC